MTTIAANSDKPARRELSFETFDEVIADVRQLELGYERAGQWTLAQACDHLERFMRCSMEGFPVRGLPRPITAVMRRAMLSERALNRPMRAGVRTPKFLAPAPDTVTDSAERRQKDHQAVERFVAMTRRVKYFGGEWYPSPLLGQLPPGMWRLLHLRHASHHLGFLVPRGQIGSRRPPGDPEFSI